MAGTTPTAQRQITYKRDIVIPCNRFPTGGAVGPGSHQRLTFRDPVDDHIQKTTEAQAEHEDNDCHGVIVGNGGPKVNPAGGPCVFAIVVDSAGLPPAFADPPDFHFPRAAELFTNTTGFPCTVFISSVPSGQLLPYAHSLNDKTRSVLHPPSSPRSPTVFRRFLLG